MYCWSWLYLIIILEYEGGVPGDVIANYTDLSITGVNTGELQGGPAFEFSYDFPSPINIPEEALVGIKIPQALTYAYLTSSDGDDRFFFATDISSIGFMSGYDLNICLGGPAPPLAVPVSNWALYTSLLLIMTFVAVKFRNRIF